MASTASEQPGNAVTVPAVPGGTAGSGPHVALKAGSDGLPLLDPAVLKGLGEELGAPEIARKFASDYAGMWVRRQHRIEASVQREDRAAAVDAAISLKVASVMVGCLRLAHLAGSLEAVLRQGDLQAGAALVAAITIQGRATVDELQLLYGPDSGIPDA
jgi:hypothetical protein